VRAEALRQRHLEAAHLGQRQLRQARAVDAHLGEERAQQLVRRRRVHRATRQPGALALQHVMGDGHVVGRGVGRRPEVGAVPVMGPQGEFARDAVGLQPAGVVRGRVTHYVEVLLARLALAGAQVEDDVVDGVPGEDLGDLVAAVAQHGGAGLLAGHVLDVGVAVGVLGDAGQQQEAVAVGREDGLRHQVQPRVLGRALRVHLDARPVGRLAGTYHAQVLRTVHPHGGHLAIVGANPAR